MLKKVRSFDSFREQDTFNLLEMILHSDKVDNGTYIQNTAKYYFGEFVVSGEYSNYKVHFKNNAGRKKLAFKVLHGHGVIDDIYATADFFEYTLKSASIPEENFKKDDLVLDLDLDVW